MALLTDTDLMPWWLAAGYDAPPWEPAVLVLPEVPEWLRDAPPSVVELGCDCGCTAHGPASTGVLPCPTPAGGAGAEEPVRWAVPGVWPDEVEDSSVGVLVTRLQEALDLLERVEPGTLPAGRALAETEALLDAQRRLRVLGLARTDDVRERELFARAGFRSASVWLRTVAPDVPAGDASLARTLPAWSHLHQAVQAGTVSLAGAGKVTRTLVKLRPYLDPVDGLIDGLDAEAVVTAVVGHVVDLVCQDRCGLPTDATVDPSRAALLAGLEAAIARIQTSSGSQTERVEQALLLLASHIHPSRLAGPLEELLLALVPSLLEERERRAHEKRALALAPNDDGTWDLHATLTPEVGEQLHTALAAEARRDPANPEDTAARAQARADAAQAAGRDGWTDAPGQQRWERDADLLADSGRLVPRSASKRLHDAFGRLLTRYLSAGLGGRHGKVPVQAAVTISERTVHGAPGAPPGRGSSGQPLARSLLRRWWCDAHITTLLLSRGWTPLGVVHTARTLTGTELTAARVQFGNRCAGLGCCPGSPDPLIPLVPHHVHRYSERGTTSLDQTLLVCDRLHADLHLGKRTVRLRDGRLVTEDGFLTDRP